MNTFTIDVASNAAYKAMESLILVVDTIPQRDQTLTALMALLLLESKAKSCIDGMLQDSRISPELIANVRSSLQANDTAMFAKILNGETSDDR